METFVLIRTWEITEADMMDVWLKQKEKKTLLFPSDFTELGNDGKQMENVSLHGPPYSQGPSEY